MAATSQHLASRREIKSGDYVGITNMKTGTKKLYNIREIINGQITINPVDDENSFHTIQYDEGVGDYVVLNDPNPYKFNFINGDFGLPGDIKLYDMLVFDFDCTITKFHTCSNHLTKTDAALPNALDMYIGLENALRFKLLIDNARKLGIKVAIASYGKKDVILVLMNQIFGIVDNPFNADNIITPADISAKFGIQWLECHKQPLAHNKNNMLEILSERYDTPKDDILLVDDTGGNIETALGSDYGGIAVSRCKGFDSVISELEEVIKSLPGL
jgi:hypothetical protein